MMMGIRPLPPTLRARLLETMSLRAVSLIEGLTLERTAIRDGDGFWHGSDPIEGTLHELVSTYETYLATPEEVLDGPRAEDPMTSPRGGRA
jgi:hypothetical protein